MTPQLRQAIQLLQYSNLEIAAVVQRELDANPLLEQDDGSSVDEFDLVSSDEAPQEIFDSTPALDTLPAEPVPDLPVPVDLDDNDDRHVDMEPEQPTTINSLSGSQADPYSNDLNQDFPANEQKSLVETLDEQIRVTFDDLTDRVIAVHLIALLCPAGRLLAEPSEIAQTLGVSLDQVERVRTTMMRFEPVGLFARDLRECLLVQLEDRQLLDHAMLALLDNLDLLARRDMPRLAAKCRVSVDDVIAMAEELRRLDPKPGSSFNTEVALPIIPDLYVRLSPEGEWVVDFNDSVIPRIVVNSRFLEQLPSSVRAREREFFSEKLSSANWLVRSLRQRALTMVRVAGAIIRRQDAFLRHGPAHLVPLVLRDIATDTQLHESTISRVTTNKYIQTPRGIFELKGFFSTSIASSVDSSPHSAEAVRHRLRTLIQSEQPSAVMSDDALVLVLKSEGILLARRTVAKYRESLGIPNSSARRRHKRA